MRVISGTAKGRKLTSPIGEKIRPTTDKIKESLFDIVQFEINGKSFLDLFSGTGQIGIEAISRNASKATFVDINADAIRIIKENIASTGLEEYSTIIRADAVSFLTKCNKGFDIVYIDPPYHTNVLDKVLPLIPSITTNQGFFICETITGKTLPQAIKHFIIHKQYQYGKTSLTIYKNKNVIS